MTASTKKSILKMSRPALCVCALILMSCFKTPEYATLKVEVSPPGSGTVSRTAPPHDGKKSWEYETGAEVGLLATANESYTFKNWTTSNGGTFSNADSATTTFTMPSNSVTVTANFTSTGTYTGGTKSIGGKTWMTENLNIETDDSWCYDENPANCNTYGRLYTWEEAKSACLSLGSEWHLPDTSDWDKLVSCKIHIS